jgi:acid phosphatase type 7
MMRYKFLRRWYFLLLFILIISNLAAQTFAIYGDTRSNPSQHRKTIAAIMKINPVAVFHTGDLVANGKSESQWIEFKKITADLRTKAQFYPVVGNHDINGATLLNHMTLPSKTSWYSVDIEDIHFALINSMESLLPGSVQYNWLENDLKLASQKTHHLIVLFHYPVFYSTKFYDNEKEYQKNLVPLFDKYGVEIVFNGHKHNYTRSYFHKTYYVVTGGGAAPLYDNDSPNPYCQKYVKTYHFCKLTLENGKLKVEAIDTDMKVIDSFVVE